MIEERVLEVISKLISKQQQIETGELNTVIKELQETNLEVIRALNEFREDIVRQVLDSFKDNTDF
jgi:methyl-accepting chemotaxis protein